jgi:hypothetical protein
METKTLRSTAASYRLEGKVAIITGGDQGIGSYHRTPLSGRRRRYRFLLPP